MAINVGELQYVLEVVDSNTKKTLGDFSTASDKAGRSAENLDKKSKNLGNTFTTANNKTFNLTSSVLKLGGAFLGLQAGINAVRGISALLAILVFNTSPAPSSQSIGPASAW